MAVPLSDAWSAVALDSLEDPISVFSLEGVYVSINAAGETLLGKRAAELVGRTYLEVFPELESHPFHEVFRRLSAAKTGIERLEFYYPPMEVWSSQRMQAVSGVIVVEWRNITTLKRAEQEQERTRSSLEREKDRYAALVRATGHIVWTNTSEGEMSGEQPDWCAFTGQTRDECAGFGWSKAVHPEDAQPTIDAWKRAVERRTTFEFEHRLRRADGQYRWFAIRAAPIMLADGSLREWVGLHSDIEEQKQAAQKLEEARLAAEAGNRTKDEFLAMLGHELRNPLAPITTALQLMRLRGAGILERERGVIERQVNHLVLLVNDLLDIARITSGKVTLTRERLELADVIAKALEISGPLIDQRQQRVSTEVPRGLIIDGDPHRLGQIFANILTNAAKFTPPGGRIEVRGAREGNDTVVHVTDTGVGIAAQLLPRVFDRFVQGHQEIDRERGGLGLGLAIVRHLVTMHGGQVSVFSPGTGKGTTFTVRLPAAGPDGTAEEAPAINPAPRSTGRRVLVVDDNEDAADLLAYALQNIGYQTRTAYDGASALRVVDSFRPDVALLDIGLPVMNGYELAQKLRALVELRPLRLVALTGYGQDRDRDRAREAGFDAHVVKPVDLTQLAALLDEKK
ncbi:MAG: ATP-binding protein [Archangium sp.]|nr:ATP-binding protein [Archangium sp.]